MVSLNQSRLTIDWSSLGVDSSKWYKAKKAKPEAAAALSAANTVQSFEDREAVYEVHRDELTAEFR